MSKRLTPRQVMPDVRRLIMHEYQKIEKEIEDIAIIALMCLLSGAFNDLKFQQKRMSDLRRRQDQIIYGS